MSNITLNKGGGGEKVIDTRSLQVPDLWHVAMYLADEGLQESSDKVLEAWHLAHDMKRHIQEAGDDCDEHGFAYPIGYMKPSKEG